MRGRARSFDLHQLTAAEKKPSLLTRLFRSRSDDHMKRSHSSPPISPKPSPKASPCGAPRRRFLRVVRDDDSAGEEYVNPHVIRKYNRKYFEDKYMCKSQSLDESRSSSLSPPKDRPYSVSGHTILKKYHSLDDTSLDTASPKHATFKEEVEVVEFDYKSKCLVMKEANVIHERLHDDEVSYGACVLAELNGEQRLGCQELMEAVDRDVTDVLSSLEVISETDERLKSPSEENRDFVDTFRMEEINGVDTSSPDSDSMCSDSLASESDTSLIAESSKPQTQLSTHLHTHVQSEESSTVSDSESDSHLQRAS